MKKKDERPFLWQIIRILQLCSLFFPPRLIEVISLLWSAYRTVLMHNFFTLLIRCRKRGCVIHCRTRSPINLASFSRAGSTCGSNKIFAVPDAFIPHWFFSSLSAEIHVNLFNLHYGNTCMWSYYMRHSSCCVTFVHELLKRESYSTLDLITQCSNPKITGAIFRHQVTGHRWGKKRNECLTCL